MANPFSVNVPSLSEAITSGEEGYSAIQKLMKGRQVEQVREQAAQEIMQGGNPQSALARLLQIGDDKGAATIATVIRNNQTAEYQNKSLAETSRYHTGSLANQAANAAETARYHREAQGLERDKFKHSQETAKGFEIKTVKDASGNEILVRVDRQGNAAPINTGAPQAPGNPYATGGKFNEVQGKAATFADRMAASHGTLTGLEGINEGLAGTVGGVLANSSIKGVGGDSALFNTFSSSDRQKVMQAQRDFVNAILRRESGAAISPGEFENAKRQYFPQPGDGPEVIEQKRRNRMISIEGNMREAGPSYRPPDGWGGKGKAPAIAPPDAAVSALRANPALREQFEKKYGPGSSARALGQQ